eukprot:3643366-Lingulodinium_polyedra.AAC.1
MAMGHASTNEKRSKRHALIPSEVFDFLYILHGINCTQYAIGTERGGQYVEQSVRRPRLIRAIILETCLNL